MIFFETSINLLGQLETHQTLTWDACTTEEREKNNTSTTICPKCHIIPKAEECLQLIHFSLSRLLLVLYYLSLSLSPPPSSRTVTRSFSQEVLYCRRPLVYILVIAKNDNRVHEAELPGKINREEKNDDDDEEGERKKMSSIFQSSNIWTCLLDQFLLVDCLHGMYNKYPSAFCCAHAGNIMRYIIDSHRISLRLDQEEKTSFSFFQYEFQSHDQMVPSEC